MTGVPTNLYDAAASAASEHGDRDFLVIGRRDEVMTFRNLATTADHFARLLAAQGVKPGDRIGLWMTNHVAWATAAYGIARIGAIAVTISTRLSSREVAHMLDLSRATVLILEDRILGKVDAVAMLPEILGMLAQRNVAAPAIILHSRSGGRHDGAVDWVAGMAAAAEMPSLPPAAELVAASGDNGHPELQGVAAILSTSGTTGNPKGVMLTHEGLCRLAYECGKRQQLDPTQRFYSVAPFFHCSGYMHGLLTNLIAGSTYFSTNKYDPDEAWDVITGERVDAYHGFVGVLQDMADTPGRDLSQIARFNRAWYSAPAARMKRLEDALGVAMCEVYGLTETGGNVAICRRSDPEEMRHDSDGQPHDGLTVRIVDPATKQTVPEGQMGEICVRGWNVMRGYFRDPEATRKAIDAEGFLHTGDQGVALPGGYIKFVSRLKDIIRVGGENLSPMEVEEVLLEHPAVGEIAVVAAPDPRLAEVPVAFIIAKPGHRIDEAEMTSFARQRLANFKVPRRFIQLDAFPRTGATNRIQKAKLREMFAEMVDG